jgi:FkbM family methyltransferase
VKLLSKTIKRVLSGLFPSGKLKEQLKCSFYNVLNTDCRFELKANVYSIDKAGILLRSHQDFYHINSSINRYLKFYTPKSGDIVLDGGSHVGQIALYLAALVGEAGQVCSFEPDSLNRRDQEANFELNHELASIIDIDSRLLWDSETELGFDERGDVGSSISSTPDSAGLKKMSVSIDSWVAERKLDRLDFVKMDIEGAEIEAIQGANEAIKRFRPNFAIASYHHVNGVQTYVVLEKYFSTIGYPFKTIVFRNGEVITYAGPAVSKALDVSDA